MSEELQNFGSVEIPVGEAKVWAEKYRRASGSDEDDKKKITAYLIPLETLRAVLDNPIDAVRAYKGINNAGEQILFFVGTKLDEKGIYRDVVFPASGIENDGEVVYDATRPCPPNGDPDSPF